MPMDLKAMLKDKKFQVGAAVAAAAGGYVLYKKRGAAGSSGTSVSTPQASPTGAGSLDTTGTDIAGWLGNYSNNLQNQLVGFQQQQTGTLEAIQNSAGVGQSRVYTVTAADAATGSNAIWNIAHQFGLGGAQVISANPWYPQKASGTLKAGQQIIIPYAPPK